MKILVVNAGSSSLKYQLIDMENEAILAKGNCDRIGIDGHIKHVTGAGLEVEYDVTMPDHIIAFDIIKNTLLSGEGAVISSLSEISAVGHRVVQGGSLFSESVIVTDKILADIETLNDLAPLHNPVNVMGIKACIECFGNDVPQAVVFDTSFHSTIPQEAYMFAIPYEYYEKYGIRRYGFHGTSHRFVTDKCAELLGKPKEQTKIITCHLGNGSSITAVKNGKSVDNSMGFTPLDGFIMGTRSGRLDPSVVTFIQEHENISPRDMNDILNKKSGMLGISGISSDNREVQSAAAEGDERAQLAFDMVDYQVRCFIGAYAAVLDGADAIVFTGGIGENVPYHREKICAHLSYLGIELDLKANESMIRGAQGEITKPGCKTKVYVILTNEELVIARDTKELISKL